MLGRRQRYVSQWRDGFLPGETLTAPWIRPRTWDALARQEGAASAIAALVLAVGDTIRYVNHIDCKVNY